MVPRLAVFALTWLSYASYYFGRRAFPVAKATLQRSFGLSTATLAGIDTAYLTTYAVGQFTAGALGDRIGSRRLIGYGMLGSAALCAAFGASSTAAAFALCFGLNGFLQATGWPGNVKAMAAWYGPRERGRVMGFWSTCFQVGPLAATAAAVWLLDRAGWRSAFLWPASWVGLVGLLVLIFLREAPARGPDARPRTFVRLDVLKNPVIWLFGASYFGMKLVRYCIDFWQPYYLENALHYPRALAGYASTAFQFGGILGAIVVGTISDRWFPGRRGVVVAVCAAALAGSLALYAVVAPMGLWIQVAAMALVGFFLFGPDALISGVAAQDLGGPFAAATVAGFINGCGSVGAIAQGPLVAGVSARFGWQAVFRALVLFAAISAATLAVAGRLQALQKQREGAAAEGDEGPAGDQADGS